MTAGGCTATHSPSLLRERGVWAGGRVHAPSRLPHQLRKAALHRLLTVGTQVIPAPVSYLSTYAPPCIAASCALDVLTPRALIVTARDLFGNGITRGAEDASLSLAVFDDNRCWVNAFLSDDTVLVQVRE